MNSSLLQEPNTPHVSRTQLCEDRILINRWVPVGRWSQTQRTQTFRLVCSNRGQSGERTQYLPRDKRSVVEVGAGETRASHCPKLERVHIGQRDGKE